MPEISVLYQQLVDQVASYQSQFDRKFLDSVYEFAREVHKDQKRLSGEPFILHPLSVALILAELQQDVKVVAASLLHDAIEDGDVTEEEIGKLFGAEIAKMVQGATKLGQLVFESKEERQAENFRKMFLAMGEDLRIIIIKLADRLHNMQTLRFLPPARQKANALETREIFAPLAHRLGMWRIKWELEDLSFRYLEPKQFAEIKDKVIDSRLTRETYIKRFVERISNSLHAMGVEGDIQGRPKHFYSIYRKMVEQNLEFEELYDLLALRIIVPTIR